MNSTVSNEWARYQESIRCGNLCNTAATVYQRNADGISRPVHANTMPNLSGPSVISQTSSYEQSRFLKQKTLRHGPVIIPLERIGSPLMDPRLEVANYGEKTNMTDLIVIKPEQWNIKTDDNVEKIKKETERVFTMPEYGIYSYRDPLGLQWDIDHAAKSAPTLPKQHTSSYRKTSVSSQWSSSLWGKSAGGRGVAQLINATKRAKDLDLAQLDMKRQKTFHNLTTQKECLGHKNALGRISKQDRDKHTVQPRNQTNFKCDSSQVDRRQTERYNIPECAKSESSVADKKKAESTVVRADSRRPVCSDRKKIEISKTKSAGMTTNGSGAKEGLNALIDDDIERMILKAKDEHKIEMRQRIGSEWERMFAKNGKDVKNTQRKEKCGETEREGETAGTRTTAEVPKDSRKRRVRDSSSIPSSHSWAQTSSRKRKRTMLDTDCSDIKYYTSELDGCKIRLIRIAS